MAVKVYIFLKYVEIRPATIPAKLSYFRPFSNMESYDKNIHVDVFGGGCSHVINRSG